MIKWFEDPSQDKTKINKLYLALAVTLAGNVLLAILKWTAAVETGSTALKSDAWNSVSDVLYSITLIFGMLISVKPADLSHPHGHERFEPVVGIGVSLSMLAAGIIALLESWQKLHSGPAPIPAGKAILVLLLAAGIKLVMFLTVRKIAQSISSRGLEAVAKDNLMDVLTSIAAVAGIFLSNLVNPLCDPIVGLLLAAWILYTAANLFIENLNYLTGHGASQEMLYELRAEIEAVPGVLGVHQLYAEYVGTKLRLDVHIDLDGDMHLDQVHAIETEIEKRMAARGDIDHVFVHAEPAGDSD